MTKITKTDDKAASKVEPKSAEKAAPDGHVWMSKGGERTLVTDDASVEIMAALGWVKG